MACEGLNCVKKWVVVVVVVFALAVQKRWNFDSRTLVVIVATVPAIVIAVIVVSYSSHGYYGEQVSFQEYVGNDKVYR